MQASKKSNFTVFVGSNDKIRHPAIEERNSFVDSEVCTIVQLTSPQVGVGVMSLMQYHSGLYKTFILGEVEALED